MLAFDDPALLAGQVAGDFVRGRDLSAFPPRLALGLRLHRRIDALSDAHPRLAAARAGFEPALRRHAGIVIDVVFDHHLARRWPHPGGRDLPEHAGWVDAALARHRPHLPPSAARPADFLSREPLLAGNVERAAVTRTLRRLSRRSPRMAPLALAAERTDALVERLEAPFVELWPELERAAHRALRELEAESAGRGAPRGPDRTTDGVPPTAARTIGAAGDAAGTSANGCR